jgi:hypothetical protein
MPASTYLANALLDHAFRNTLYTRPAVVYLMLDKVLYAVDATGGTPMTGTGVARQAITHGAAASRQISSTAALTFTTDAPADWAQTVVAFSVWDALTAGNMLWTDLLTAQLVIAQHSIVQVAAGQEALIFS